MKVERKEEKKKKPELTDEEKERILHDANATGLASLITGGTMLGMAALGKNAHRFNNKAAKTLAEKVAKNPKIVGTLNVGGAGLGVAGAGLLGTSAYLSHKKKKEKEKNDSTKE